MCVERVFGAGFSRQGAGQGLIQRAMFATLTGGLLAFAMLLVELRVVQLASSLTLSVAGIFKEVLTVLASVAMFGDVLTPTRIAGLVVCLLGIGAYQVTRYRELR